MVIRQELMNRVIADGPHATEAMKHLTSLSSVSKLVRCIVAESLVNCDIRVRVAALKLLPKVLFPFREKQTRDCAARRISGSGRRRQASLTCCGGLASACNHALHCFLRNKVRKEAETALEALGLQGRLIQGLPTRLTHSSESVRIEALQYIGKQRTMAAALLLQLSSASLSMLQSPGS